MTIFVYIKGTQLTDTEIYYLFIYFQIEKKSLNGHSINVMQDWNEIHH